MSKRDYYEVLGVNKSSKKEDKKDKDKDKEKRA